MRATADIDTAVTLISTLLRSKVEVDEEGYKFLLSSREITLSLTHEKLAEILEDVNGYRIIEETSVALGRSFEVLLRRDSGFANRAVLRNGRGMCVSDPQGGRSYTIGAATSSYALFLLLNIPPGTDLRRLRGAVPIGYYIERMSRPDEPIGDAVEVLVRYLNLRTLRIESQTIVPADKWQRLVDAFLFSVGYNLDVAITQERYIEELVRPARISRLRRSDPEDMDAPRREYIPDLVHHYQLGVSAESPMLEYLSYYHVAEHWFESVYHEDLVAKLQKQITSPGFSFKRTKDVEKVIRTVTRAIQVRNDEHVISELVALRLTLERHVDIESLADDLEAFEPGLVNFFRQEKVGFCDGDIVDLSHADRASVYLALSKRIYKTRNALVHSKDGAKARFIPFSHDKQLIQEVALMRLLAEQIIVSSSTIL
ncbi:hypothetical protein ACSVDM_17870 [Nocardia sp. JW2]|uniref:hypothetical protein n=1 Tax=Nocardia sp. JW2 TaxID=3450738 RepID=UPI003F42E6D9